MEMFKQKIVSNIDTLRGMILSFNKEEIEKCLSEGHIFQYTANRVKDSDGNEYTVISTVTIAREKSIKEKPLLKIL